MLIPIMIDLKLTFSLPESWIFSDIVNKIINSLSNFLVENQ